MARLATPLQPALMQRNRAPARLWLPRRSLSRCVRAIIARSTVGVGRAWPAPWRENHFPATPLCSIGWFIEGGAEVIHADGSVQPVPRTYFAGPSTRPTRSRNPTEGHGMILLLLPDAVQALTGIDPARWVNRFADLHEALDGPWLALDDAVRAAPDDEARIACIEAFLEPRWLALRPDAGAPALHVRDWAHALAARAAGSGAGRSLRQCERRIKGWTGLPMRELRGMGRVEQAFIRTLTDAEPDEPVRWSELAAETGYADQSHLCRETRRITGFAPQELRRRIAEDESFWLYRIWL